MEFKDDHILYRILPQKQFYLVVSLESCSSFEIDVVDKKMESIQRLGLLPLEDKCTKKLIPIQFSKIEKFVGSQLRIKPRKIFDQTTSKVRISQKSFFSTEINQEDSFHTFLLSELRIQLNYENSQSPRLMRLLLMGSAEESSTLGFDMFANNSRFFPNQFEHEITSVRVENKLLVSIQSNHSFFCVTPLCQYSVTVLLKDVAQFNFQSSYYQQNSLIQLRNELSLFEVLDPNDNVTFTFQVE